MTEVPCSRSCVHKDVKILYCGSYSIVIRSANDGVVDGVPEEDLIDDAEIDSMIREAISQVVGENPFVHAKINAWSSNIVEGCLKRLAALQKPFKYVVTCNLSQKAGAGLHAASCQRWNDKTDGKLTVPWENDTMLILVTVYWLAI